MKERTQKKYFSSSFHGVHRKGVDKVFLQNLENFKYTEAFLSILNFLFISYNHLLFYVRRMSSLRDGADIRVGRKESK